MLTGGKNKIKQLFMDKQSNEEFKMEIVGFNTALTMMIDANQLSWVYHVINMIIVFLQYVSTGVVHDTTELAWVPM